MLKNKDQLIGMACGTVAPVVGFYIYAGIKYHTLHLLWLLRFLTEHNKLSALISLCLLMNLGVFYLFIWRNRDQSARGVLFITIFYALVGAIIKFCF